jgi:xanthine dehydrogenase iron-sulfur cluster and FAD-binding subunit A
MSGNLCRCGAYVNIVAAVGDVADGRAGEMPMLATGDVAP